MKIKYIFAYIFFLLVVVTGCKSDEPQITVDKLSGYWEVAEAYRNGRLTRTMKNGFFKINPDTTMKTNILKDTADYSFSLDGILMNVSDLQEMTYEIMYLSEDTLIMDTKLLKYDFRFISLKKKPSSEHETGE